MLRSGDVLGVAKLKRLHHFAAIAAPSAKNTANWGMALRSGTVMRGDRGCTVQLIPGHSGVINNG